MLGVSTGSKNESDKIMATIHIDEVKALAQRAHSDAAAREELFAAALADDGRRSSQAAWVLTHLPKEDVAHVAKHRDELIRVAMSTNDTSLRRIFLSLLERLQWDDVDVRLLDFCLDRMSRRDEPYGVRSLCMKLAYTLSCHYPELKDELRRTMEYIEPDELGAGVRCARKKILNML